MNEDEIIELNFRNPSKQYPFSLYVRIKKKATKLGLCASFTEDANWEIRRSIRADRPGKLLFASPSDHETLKELQRLELDYNV
jgi:hypothetical protein